jgi:hypothetical protein
MAYYLVKARFHTDLLTELRSRLDNGEIEQMQPFGRALKYSLENARIDPQGWAVWEEEDYCNPPLAQERAAVLDTYFTDLSVEHVQKGDGWEQIKSLLDFWEKRTGG